MSVPSDRLMELMRSQRAPEAPGETPTSPGFSNQDAEPQGSPMATPEPKMGSKEGALINIGMALDLLEQSLPSLGGESEEGQKALAAIRALTGVLGPRKSKVNELQQSEILQLLQTLPQAGGSTPEQKSLAAAPVPGMPPGMGGAPQGMPGGMPQPPM